MDSAFWSGIAGLLVGNGVITACILRHFEKRLERKYKILESSAAVADIVSEWVAPRYLNPNGKATNRDLWRIQTRYWKAILWLPADLAKALGRRLTSAPNPPSTMDVLAEARTLLQGRRDLEGNEIVYWDPLNEDQTREPTDRTSPKA